MLGVPKFLPRSYNLLNCFVLLALAGCGGQECQHNCDAVAVQPPPLPPIVLPSTGPVVGLGVVWAPTDTGWYWDGPMFTVSASTDVRVDGAPVLPADLAIDDGEVVLLAGTEENDPDRGSVISATAVHITHMVDGPVDAVDPVHGTMVVLGQTVLAGIPADPQYHAGDRVLVSGHPSASGEIVATRIAPSVRTGEFLVSGIVTSPDTQAKQFTLNGVRIDYGAAQFVAPQGSPGEPSKGERVLVWGTRAAGASVIVATTVSDNDTVPPGDASAFASLYGIVTAIDSSDYANVDGLSVSTLDRRCLGSVGDTTLVLNGRVVVQGPVGADYEIDAKSSCYADPAPDPLGLIQGPIESIDASYGTLTIVGFKVQPDVTSHIVDITGAPIPLSDLKVGDVVRVGGAAPVDAVMGARTIGMLSSDSPSVLRAFDYDVQLAEPVVSLYGRPIATDIHTLYYTINSSNHAVTPLPDPSRFWSGSEHWPHWDKICRPSVAVTVQPQADGSLYGSSIVIEPDYC